ncbi:hypothetical protein AHAS_Ahas02G0178000 [Arachis hypogaea]
MEIKSNAVSIIPQNDQHFLIELAQHSFEIDNPLSPVNPQKRFDDRSGFQNLALHTPTLEPPLPPFSPLALTVSPRSVSPTSFRRNLRLATVAVARSVEVTHLHRPVVLAFCSHNKLSFQPSKSQPPPAPVAVASVFLPAPALFDPSTPVTVPVAASSAFFSLSEDLHTDLHSCNKAFHREKKVDWSMEVEQPKPKPTPKRFVKNQIPDYILNDAALNAAISVLPHNYNFEVHKCVWRVLSTGAKRVALQFPEGLLMYSLPLSDILTAFAAVDRCYVLGDVTYGACCVDDFSAAALSADLLIHYGHSCLVPIDSTTIPCLYVFVDIKIDVSHLVDTFKLNLESRAQNLVLAGTIQFASAIRAAKPELEKSGFSVLVPQSKPLSAGEVLGCTAPKVSLMDSFSENPENSVLVFVADGRFHLEAIMIANPGIKAFRYDPYIGKLFLEEYDHVGMKESRKGAILRAREEARNWGVVLGTLGRQGNPKILERLEKNMKEKGFFYTVFLMSEISPARIALFEDSVDAWIQIACPRLSIDWGDAFGKPVLNPFEAEIALGVIPGWWEKKKNVLVAKVQEGCEDGGVSCQKSGDSSCECSCGEDENGNGKSDFGGEYPMDYYSQDGGEWNSSYVKKSSRPVRRISVSSVAISAISQQS